MTIIKNLDDFNYITETSRLAIISSDAYRSLRTLCNNDNKFAAYLSILADGYKPLEENYTFKFEAGSSYTVTKTDYDYVINTLPTLVFLGINEKTQKQEEITYYSVITKTPGWKLLTNDGEYENPVGWSGVGSLASLAAMVNGSPITGPAKNTPSVCEDLLNKLSPKFTENIERFCNMIRSRSYLALPAMAFGSLQRVVARLNGVIKSFQRAIYAIYQGAIRIIQQYYSYINGILKLINIILMNIIERIIPLDLICLILEAVQVLLDDVGFFTSLFTQSGSIFNYLNQIQSYVNIASGFANKLANPLDTIMSYLPPQVKEIIDMVDEIGSDPSGFLSDQLSNYGMSYVADALEGNIMESLIAKFGKQHKAIPAIASYLNRFSSEIMQQCKEPSKVSPTLIPGTDDEPALDYNLNPIAGSFKIIKRTGDKVEANLKEAFTGIGDSVKQVGKEAEYLSNAPQNALKYMMSSAKTQEEVEKTGLGGDLSLVSPECVDSKK
jgi:hypothetical protein